MEQVDNTNLLAASISYSASRLSAFNQPHYTVDQVAEMWNMSRDCIRRLFLREPGVLKIARSGSRHKRSYTTLRIPETVLSRVYRRISGEAC
jgi:hypothetical protein